MWASTRGLIVAGSLAILLVTMTAVTFASDSDSDVSYTVTDGQALFHTQGRIGCHAITLTSSGGSIGPNLTDLPQLAATRIEGMTASDYIRQSIQEPGAFTVRGYGAGIMPMLPLADTEVASLVDYLLNPP